MIQGWVSEDGDDLTWFVSFFWDFEDRQVYLDIDYKDLTIWPID